MRISCSTYPRPGRPRRPQAALLAALCAAALGAAGCGSSGQPKQPPRGALTVYSSIPRHGVSAARGAAVVAGERLALADAHGRAGGRELRLVQLDPSRPGRDSWDPTAVERNAHRAADDPAAIAYLGELSLGASAVSVPITSEAGLLEVSPGDGLTPLTRPDPDQPDLRPDGYYPERRRNFLRLVPTDSDQADALVAWARSRGARSLAIVRDDRLFGRAMGAEVAGAARRAHVPVTDVLEGRQDAGDYADVTAELAKRPAGALVYTGIGGVQGERLLAAAASALPRAKLYATNALAEGALPGGDAAGRAFAGPGSRPVDLVRPATDASTRPARRVLARLAVRPGTTRALDALYGYEAMRLALDAVAAGGADREDVTRAALRPRTRSSVLGTYAVRPSGDVAPAGVGYFRRAGGELRFLGLRAP